MLKSVKNELKSVIKDFGFGLGFTCIMTMCMLNTALYAYQNMYSDVSEITHASGAFILNADSRLSGIFSIVYMFIILLPASFRHRKNVRNSTVMNIMVRTGVTGYYVIEVIACFIGTFLMLFLPLIIEICVNELVFPSKTVIDFSYNSMSTISGDNVLVKAYSSGMPFPSLFLSNPELYNILYAFIFSFCCGIYASFVYALSLYIKNYPIVLFLPIFVLGQIAERLQPFLDSVLPIILNVNAYEYITISYGIGFSPVFIVTYFLIIVLAIILMIRAKICRDQFGI